MSTIAVDLLKRQSSLGYEALLRSLEGVTESQAWGVMPKSTEEYLHTDGSIHAVVLHVATGKIMYGSAAFKGLEIHWRDLAEEIESFEPSWDSALEYLAASQKYWTESWADLKDADLVAERQRPQGDLWPTWKIVHTVTDHDAYHAGQIAVLKFAGNVSATPPPSVADDIRKYCPDLPSW